MRQRGLLIFLGILFFAGQGAPGQEPQEFLLSAASIANQEQDDQGTELLGRANDFFLRRAAFDFGAVWFRYRGLGSEQQKLYLNGISLNSPLDGRPDWSRLGGLTDIGRNPAQGLDLAFNPNGFGSLGEFRMLNARPTNLRAGNRLTFSVSNRNYRWREMFSYNTGASPNGLNLLVSISHRHAQSGYVKGTPYRSIGAYAMLQWTPSKIHELALFGVMSKIERGTRPALTEEVRTLTSDRYNPQWGWDQGKIRNARLRSESLPLIGFNYRFKRPKLKADVVLGYFGGNESRDRLNYAEASNPDPVYYRNLPSYYVNSPLGPNYWNASLATEYLGNQPRINWDRLRQANILSGNEESARYALLADFMATRMWRLRASFQFLPSSSWEVGGIFEWSKASLDFGQNLKDLLGASGYRDADPFSNTVNDLHGDVIKKTGDRVGYSYNLINRDWNFAFQAKRTVKKWEVALGGLLGRRSYRREGLFRNGRYPDISRGKSEPQHYSSKAFKMGLGYRLSGRHWIYGYYGYRSLPPQLGLAFIDPRQHNLPFPSEASRAYSGGSLNWFLRHPRFKGRISSYYFQDIGGRDLKSYFIETPFGSAFAREVSWGYRTLHLGLEGGVEIQLNPEFSLGLAGTLGRFRHIAEPRIQLYTWPDPTASDPLPKIGFLDAGAARIQGSVLPNSPEKAASLSLSYRSPQFWWMEFRMNYLGSRSLNPALLRHTDLFTATPAPETPDPFIPPGVIAQARQFPRLDAIYLLNLSLGKSWRYRGKYISAFLGVNNLLAQAYRSGGYQQGRMASLEAFAEDIRSGRPSFAPKFWNGYGRTYFFNLSLNL